VRVRVHVSVMTLDETVAARLEPGAARPRQRLAAVRSLVAAGIDAGIAVAPILPGLTDGVDALAALVSAAREAGATRVWGRDLYLAAGTREHFLAALERGWPELRARYHALYARGAYLAKAEGEELRARVKRQAQEQGIADRRDPQPAPASELSPVQLVLELSPTAPAACRE